MYESPVVEVGEETVVICGNSYFILPVHHKAQPAHTAWVSILIGCVSFQLESGQPSRRLPFSIPKHSVF